MLVGVIDEGIALESAERWFDFNLTAVTLTTKIKLDHRNRQELCIATNIGGHRDFSIGILLGGCI